MRSKLSFLILVSVVLLIFANFNLFFILVFAGLLIFANLVASNRLSTAGEKIKVLEIEIERLNSENSSLELEIARSSSLSGVIKRAENLGFIHSPEVFYLKGEPPVAMRQ